MHDLLFKNQEQLSEALHSALAEKLGLSQTALPQALEEGNTKIAFERTSAVEFAAESTVPRRSSSMGCVMIELLTTKPSSWPYEKKW